MFGLKKKDKSEEISPTVVQRSVALGKSTIKVMMLRPVGFLGFQAHKATAVARHQAAVAAVTSVVGNTYNFTKEGIKEGYVNSRQSYLKRQIIRVFNKAETDNDISEGMIKIKTFLSELNMSQQEVDEALQNFKNELLQEETEVVTQYC